MKKFIINFVADGSMLVIQAIDMNNALEIASKMYSGKAYRVFEKIC